MKDKPEQERLRISDLAKLLNISRGTVDRALHNRPGVKPEIRKMILEEAEKRGYRTNRAARSLAMKTTYTIGVLIPAEPRSYWQGVEEGFLRAASEVADLGVRCVFYSQGLREAANDLALIREALEAGVDALALATFNDDAISELIDQAAKDGIPTVTFISDLPKSRRICFIGNNPEKEGRVAGEIIGKLLQGQGQVMIFRGKRGLNSIARCEGFREVVLRDYPGLVICREEELFVSADRMRDKIRMALEEVPDLNGIFVANSFTDYIAPVLVEFGLEKQVKLVGFDLTEGTEAHLKSGVVDVIITQNSFRQGYETFKILTEYLMERKRPITDTVQGSIEIVFREMLID